MRCQDVRAAKAVATLLALGVADANDLSTEEACRIHARAQRGSRSGTTKPLALLVAESTRRRRARITHPGKRGRG